MKGVRWSLSVLVVLLLVCSVSFGGHTRSGKKGKRKGQGKDLWGLHGPMLGMVERFQAEVKAAVEEGEDVAAGDNSGSDIKEVQGSDYGDQSKGGSGSQERSDYGESSLAKGGDYTDQHNDDKANAKGINDPGNGGAESWDEGEGAENESETRSLMENLDGEVEGNEENRKTRGGKGAQQKGGKEAGVRGLREGVRKKDNSKGASSKSKAGLELDGRKRAWEASQGLVSARGRWGAGLEWMGAVRRGVAGLGLVGRTDEGGGEAESGQETAEREEAEAEDEEETPTEEGHTSAKAWDKGRIMRLAARVLRYWETAYPKLKNPSSGDSSFPTSPRPPHLEDCEHLKTLEWQLDSRADNGSRPKWSFLGGEGYSDVNATVEAQLFGEGALEDRMLNTTAGASLLGPFPPWVVGADEENLPLTRRVQRDIWLHQHPRDCGAPGVRFLVAHLREDHRPWDPPSVTFHLGVGAQLKVAACLLGEAIRQNRVLVLQSYNRAQVPICKGNNFGMWSCYFAPEVSWKCRKRALELVKERRRAGVDPEDENDDDDAQVLEWGQRSYKYGEPSPSNWGTPWERIEPTVLFEGKQIKRTLDDSHRWFRAQAVRYLMRFPSQHLCHATNRARHAAFGQQAALRVAEALLAAGEETVPVEMNQTAPLEPYWQRQPLFQGGAKTISVHVRQGDKMKEMVMKNFSDHMKLAASIRMRFPEASSIWLITEMQDVIDDTAKYPGWKFYFTNVQRQGRDTEIRKYEKSLGLGKSTTNAFVNLLIGVGCDFFVGTMGSTFSLIIDDLRRTSGKESRALLTVNRDRTWISMEEKKRLGLYIK